MTETATTKDAGRGVLPARPPVGASEDRTCAEATSLLTAEQVAVRWQVPTSQVYRLTRDGHLPVVRLGRYYRYAIAALEEFERAGGVSGQ